MNNLRIYRVDDRYIRFLKSRDHRVQDNKNKRRPYVGIVLTVGQYEYFVPMESPKPNHANIKSGKHIMRLDGGRLGLLGFNNMIPVRDAPSSTTISARSRTPGTNRCCRIRSASATGTKLTFTTTRKKPILMW